MLPDKFSSYKKAAEFWDSHDTKDYADYFETIEAEINLKQRHYEIDTDLIPSLTELAQKRGVTIESVVSEMFRENYALLLNDYRNSRSTCHTIRTFC